MKIKNVAGFLFMVYSCCCIAAKAAPADSLMSVVYGNNDGADAKRKSLTMDIFFPQKEAGKKYPLVMLMHGGGFSTGSKEAMKGHIKILADSGFVAVSINYRKGWNKGDNPLACEGDMEDLQLAVYRATQDARAALRFLVEKRAEYAIDTAWIFVGGSSAGGVLALNLAYLGDEDVKKLMPAGYKALGSLDEATNNNKNTFSIKGICSMWGGLSDSTLVTPAKALPTIFYHGTADMIVPYNIGHYGTICEKYPLMFGSACMYRQTLAAGQPAVLNISEGGNHGPKEFYSKITMSNTACFFRQVMAGTAVSNTFKDAKAGCR